MQDVTETLPKATNIIQVGIDRGLHVGAQLYVSVKGECVAEWAFGLADAEANGGEGIALTTDHLMLWLSACKPVGAVAIGQLWEQGLIDLDAPIVETIPEFGKHGKDGVTMRHILTHTGGFREVDLGFVEQDWDEAVRKVCEAPLEEGWLIGKSAGYDPRGAWYILGEVVQRINGRPFRQYVRQAIFDPVGMYDSWIGMTPEAYREYGTRITPLYETKNATQTKTDMHSEANCAACFPAGNAVGPVRELGYFYEMLLDGGQRRGVRLLKSSTVEEFTWPQRVGTFDQTFRHKMDWGLGFVLDSKKYGAQTVPYGFGLHCSQHTFGHGGRQCSTGFADPEHGLVVALVFNGMPGEPRHNKRIRDFATALYEDLDLVR